MTLFQTCGYRKAAVFFVLALALLCSGLAIPPEKVMADISVRASAGLGQTNLRGQPAVLNEAALKAAISHRLRTARESKDERFSRLTPDKVTIEGQIPVHTGGMVFFAVKLKILPLIPEARPEFITLVVDQTGTLQMGSIQDLASGADLVKNAVDQLQAVNPRDLPPGFGKEIFTGPGPHTVIAISDPFCPHCRKGWDYIKLNQDKISTFRLAHFPLNKASETACLVIADAYHRQFMVFDIIDFSYTHLTKAGDPQDILLQYMDAFPDLAKTWGNDPGAALAYLKKHFLAIVKTEQNTVLSLGIHSTPVYFVNNLFIKGFDAGKMESAMP